MVTEVKKREMEGRIVSNFYESKTSFPPRKFFSLWISWLKDRFGFCGKKYPRKSANKDSKTANTDLA